MFVIEFLLSILVIIALYYFSFCLTYGIIFIFLAEMLLTDWLTNQLQGAESF